MNRLLRSCGVAAAAIGCLAGANFASPLEANDYSEAADQHYLVHAVAQIDGGDAVIEADMAGASDSEIAVQAAAKLMKLAEAAVPRPRTLDDLVAAYDSTKTEDGEQDCLASAVYFEARGEPVLGQLAVAEVVLNRAASGRYPEGVCAVVEQPWQFSFVNATGSIPDANRSSAAWRKAVAIARIAELKVAGKLPGDVLWYHADYVAPSWGKRLDKQAKIGLHIFYS